MNADRICTFPLSRLFSNHSSLRGVMLETSLYQLMCWNLHLDWLYSEPYPLLGSEKPFSCFTQILTITKISLWLLGFYFFWSYLDFWLCFGAVKNKGSTVSRFQNKCFCINIQIRFMVCKLLIKNDWHITHRHTINNRTVF